MRKLLFILLIFLYPLSGFAAQIDERKVDIYVANGMSTRLQDAQEHAELVQKAVFKNLYNSNLEEFENKIEKVEESYNTTFIEEENGELWDGLESVFQKLGLQGLVDLFFETAHERDLHKQVDAYKNSIKSGHGVLVVAESQGNFFTHEAYNDIEDWMQNYFEVVSVSSPMTFPIKPGTPAIAWDNDWIPNFGIYTTNTIENPIRKITWSPYDDSDLVAEPTVEYVYKNQIDKIYKNAWRASDFGWNDFFATKIHFFPFYMGKPLNKYIYSRYVLLNPFDGKPMQTDLAKNAILEAIEQQLTKLQNQPSQWQIEENNVDTNVCEERRAKLVHFKNAVTLNNEVYPFNVSSEVIDYKKRLLGKVYPLESANETNYVLASPEGTKIIDLQDGTDNRCYELNGTNEYISIENSCADINVTNGIITVDLVWQNKLLDLDLNVDNENVSGHYENQDTGCPMEHFYITQEEVQVGIYKVRVSPKGDYFDKAPQDVYVIIKAKDKTETLQIKIEDAAAFDMGYIAEIEVKPNGDTSTTTPHNTSSGAKINKSASPPTNSVYGDNINYKIIPLLNQLLFGPVSSAELELYEIRDYASSLSPLFIGATSSGSDLHTAGLIIIPFTLLEELDSNSLYLLKAQGGKDIDADDDGIVDSQPRYNSGSLHGVFSADELKDGAFKMNVLTELVYQVTKEMFDVNTSEEIVARIDLIAPRMLQTDVDGDGVINHKDIVKWMPTLDKEKLVFDYNTTLEPIVQKLFNNEDVYEDAKKLLYYPVADAGEDAVVNTTNVVLDGSNSYDINGEIVQYIWQRGEHILCQSSEAKCEVTNLNIGTHYIDLYVTDNDGEVRSDSVIVRVDLNAPVADAGEDITISFGESVTLDGSGSYDSDGQIVTYLWHENGTVYCQGESPVCIVEDINIGNHRFELVVIDNQGIRDNDAVEVLVEGELSLIGSYATGSYSLGVTLSDDGTKAYIADTYKGITIIDISDPTQLSLVGRYDTNYAVDIAISADSNFAYVADSRNGLQIFDISNPAIPSIVSQYINLDNAVSLAISGDSNIVYIAAGTSGLQIIDVSNPINPQLRGVYNASYYAQSVTLSNDGKTVFMTDYSNDLFIIDVSDPGVPTLISSYQLPESPTSITLSANEGIAYISSIYEGVQIIDISNLESPSLIGGYNTLGNTENIALSIDGKLAYVADGYGGVDIVDVSSPAEPLLVSSYDNLGAIWDIKLSNDGTKAYMTNGRDGLHVFDISAFAH